MRNDFRLHPTPNPLVARGRLPLKRGLLAISTLIICVSVIYAAIFSSETTTPPGATPPAPNKLSLAIPGIDPNISSSQQKRVEIAPLPATAEKPKPIASKVIPIPTNQPDTTQSGSISIALVLPEPKLLPEPRVSADKPDTDQRWLEETVTSGDSLARIFSRLGLSAKLLHRITNSGDAAKGLTRIRPGESLRIRLDNQGRLQELIYQRSAIESLHITPDGGGFKARTEIKKVENRLGYQSGTIVSSFYLSAQKAGLSDALIMDLATIFGWDIDFALEIRKGDRFSVVYEEGFLNGNRHGNGRILAAEFV
ncbi:MAG: hypothetical protein GY934_14750, partial [Gammaproteobacteria bacterium]|nr:hypothetical protein [Gammaproteobacteria bacterium]